MARLFTKGTANYMSLGVGAIGSLLHGATAMSFHYWAMPGASMDVVTGTNRALFIRLGASLSGLSVETSTVGSVAPWYLRITARSQSSDGFQIATSAASFTTGAFVSLGGVLNFTGDTVTPYVNGAASGAAGVAFGSNTWVQASPADGDGIGCAPVPPTASNLQWDGRLAEMAIWIGDIGANAFAALANRAPVQSIRTGTLVGYWPLYGAASPERDLSGNAKHGTITGTIARADHPPVMMPYVVPRGWRGISTATGGGTTPIAASDTSAIGMSELAGLLGRIGISDQLPLGLTAAANILGGIGASDTVSIRVIEAEQIAAIVSDADSVAVALSALMSAAVVLTPSDNVSLALSDAASILGRLDASDAVPVSVIEAVNLLGLLTASDGVGLDLAEAASLLASLDQSDLIGLSLTEAASAAILLFASVADSLGIGISEAAALVQAQAVAVSDAMGLTLIEALTVSAGVIAAESVGVELSEVLTASASLDIADVMALDVTELLAIAGTLSVPDAIALGLVDTAIAAAVVEISDTFGLTTAEAFSVLGSLLIVDDMRINLAELEALVMVGVVPEGDPITGFTLPAILVGGDDRHAELVCG